MMHFTLQVNAFSYVLYCIMLDQLLATVTLVLGVHVSCKYKLHKLSHFDSQAKFFVANTQNFFFVYFMRAD